MSTMFAVDADGRRVVRFEHFERDGYRSMLMAAGLRLESLGQLARRLEVVRKAA